jgi:hypothetical protein
LDGDHDKKISLREITIDRVPSDVLKIIEPLIEELNTLESGTGFIDKEEFVDAMLRLYQTLNSKEKDDLLNFDKPPAIDPYQKVCTFKPHISKN